MVSLDAEGRAEGILYEDDGEGYDYQAGDYLLTTYSAVQLGDRVEVSVASEEGIRERPVRALTVIVITDGGTFEGSGADGSTIPVSLGGP